MSRKKTAILLSAALIGTFILLVVARHFRIYAFYSLPTTNMDPTYKVGQRIFGTCLVPEEKNDIVAYRADPMPFEDPGDPYDALARIVAVGGDKLQMIDGLLYVNKKMVDDTMLLSYHFALPQGLEVNFTDYQKLYKLEEIAPLSPAFLFNGSFSELKDLGLTLPRKRDTAKLPPFVFEDQNKENWDYFNLGPLTVPKDHYFVLGDNRSNSSDSRIRGFIHKEKIRATIISK